MTTHLPLDGMPTARSFLNPSYEGQAKMWSELPGRCLVLMSYRSLVSDFRTFAARIGEYSWVCPWYYAAASIEETALHLFSSMDCDNLQTSRISFRPIIAGPQRLAKPGGCQSCP